MRSTLSAKLSRILSPALSIHHSNQTASLRLWAVFFTAISLTFLLMVATPAAAQGHRKGPKVTIAEDMTPLAKKWQKKIDDDLDKVKAAKPH